MIKLRIQNFATTAILVSFLAPPDVHILCEVNCTYRQTSLYNLTQSHQYNSSTLLAYEEEEVLKT